jgi:hypothetical protein
MRILSALLHSARMVGIKRVTADVEAPAAILTSSAWGREMARRRISRWQRDLAEVVKILKIPEPHRQRLNDWATTGLYVESPEMIEAMLAVTKAGKAKAQQILTQIEREMRKRGLEP